MKLAQYFGKVCTVPLYTQKQGYIVYLCSNNACKELENEWDIRKCDTLPAYGEFGHSSINLVETGHSS